MFVSAVSGLNHILTFNIVKDSVSQLFLSSFCLCCEVSLISVVSRCTVANMISALPVIFLMKLQRKTLPVCWRGGTVPAGGVRCWRGEGRGDLPALI